MYDGCLYGNWTMVIRSCGVWKSEKTSPSRECWNPTVLCGSCYSLPPISWLQCGQVVGLFWYFLYLYLRNFLSCCVKLRIYWHCSPGHFDFDTYQNKLWYIIYFTIHDTAKTYCDMSYDGDKYCLLINLDCIVYLFQHMVVLCMNIIPKKEKYKAVLYY